jgi:DNA-binding CsgD family transcriptional regulator/PAS domain-containing protein
MIYAASAEPARWHEAVAAIAHAMKAVQVLLFTPYVGPANGGFFYPWGIQERDLVLYGTKYIDHDLWAQSAQRKGLMQEGVVAFDHELVPQDELLASIYYREFLSPMGVARLCSGVVFGGAPGLPAAVLSIYRGLDDEPFGLKDRELMYLLMPHLSRSLGLMHRLGAARHQAASLRAALDRLNIGVLLLNQDLAVTFTNAAAARVLSRNDGLSIGAQQQLVARGSAQGKLYRMGQWLTEFVNAPAIERGGFADTFDVLRSPGQSSYSVQCCPLESNDPLVNLEGARHIVFITDPKALKLPELSQLSALLGVTPAEARVSLALVQSGTYTDVAAGLNVSVDTVRSHVKAIYAKTRVNNKAALTRLVLSLSQAGA